MADIFEEVDEELRRDRAKILWDKYGKFVIALAVLVVLGTSANVYWRQYQQSQRLEHAQQFMTAAGLAQAGQTDQAISEFLALASDSGAGYATIARLRAAALKSSGGDVEGAVAEYNALAADSDVDQIYRDLAVLLRVIAEGDSAAPEALLEDLAPLAENGKAWRFTARELAVVQHLRQGDTAQAREKLTALADDLDAPRGIRSRASELLRALDQ